MSIAKKKQTMVGTVVGCKMKNTVSVLIKTKRRREVYGKYEERRQQLLVDDQKNICKEGDSVLIQSCRPISKRKSWMVLDVLRG